MHMHTREKEIDLHIISGFNGNTARVDRLQLSVIVANTNTSSRCVTGRCTKLSRIIQVLIDSLPVKQCFADRTRAAARLRSRGQHNCFRNLRIRARCSAQG